MTPFEKQKSCEKRFFAFCIAVIQKEIQRAFRDLNRYRDREVSLTSLSERDFMSLFECSTISAEKFHVLNFCIAVDDAELADALKQLKQKQRDIILLYYLRGFHDSEIAVFLGMEKTTVHYNRHAALTKLRKLMEVIK